MTSGHNFHHNQGSKATNQRPSCHALLADAMAPIRGLRLFGGVIAPVEVDHMVGRREVQANASTPCFKAFMTCIFICKTLLTLYQQRNIHIYIYYMYIVYIYMYVCVCYWLYFVSSTISMRCI